MPILVRFLNPLLMIALGLLAGVLFAARRTDGWRLYGVGVWTFILSQVGHIPFNAWVLSPVLVQMGVASNADLASPAGLAAAVLLGLSAGVFEETARYLAYRFAIPRARSWGAALAFGSGHGGVEAILVGAFTLYSVVQLVAVQSPEALARLSASQLEALALAEGEVAVFWSAPWYAVLLGALERLFAICVHLAAAVLVLQVFRRRNLLWLSAAVLWHTLVNAAGVLALVHWGAYAAEGVIGFFALVSVGIVIALRSPEAETAGEPDVSAAQPLLELEPEELTAEDIEGSRYG